MLPHNRNMRKQGTLAPARRVGAERGSVLKKNWRATADEDGHYFPLRSRMTRRPTLQRKLSCSISRQEDAYALFSMSAQLCPVGNCAVSQQPNGPESARP